MLFALTSYTAQALEVSVEPCVTEPTEITDMAFVTPKKAILTTRTGALYWFEGCDQPVEKIGTIADVDNSTWQLGLYSIAINWNFYRTHRIYVYYTAQKAGQLVTRLSTLRLMHDKNGRSLSDGKVILEIPQPFENSNGGGMRFGPDGALYLGIGDGGSDGDPQGNAQNVHNLLGSILRIYPSGRDDSSYWIPRDNLYKFMPEALPEILLYGVRNPWKLTFDSRGDLIVADVGEHTTEEVDLIPTDKIGTQVINLGWNIKEGKECFNNQDCSSDGLLDPIYEYQHYGTAGNAITGGETLWVGGKEYYLFADYSTGHIGVLDLDHPAVPVQEITESGKNWTAFGRSPDGQVYIADYAGGGIYRINAQP
jgi:glucose/arabinose dehydrogenase